MKSSYWVLASALLATTSAARADSCADFTGLAQMSREAIASHERGVDPDADDDSTQLSDLTLLGWRCDITTLGGSPSEVLCGLRKSDKLTLNDYFDAADECLRDSATKISREPGERNHIWTKWGTMVKMWDGGDWVFVNFVY